MTMLTFSGPRRGQATTVLGRILDAYMDATHTSQNRLADLLDMDPASLSRIRGGSRHLGSGFARWAEVLVLPVATVILAAHEIDPEAWEAAIRADERAKIIALLTEQEAA